MKQILILFFSLLLSILIHGQESKRDNIWMLGMAAAPNYPQFGIDFNSGNADTFSLLRPMAFFTTNASICDTNGQLLFYTNGNYVSNRLHQMLPGTSGFNPGDENTATYPFGSGLNQGALVLPWPDNPVLYLLIHLNADDFWIGNHYYGRPLSLRYSVIDMRLDSGYGDFTNYKNEILIEDTLVSGRISACKHANGRDWWIFAHELWSDQFYKFLLTPDSIYLYQLQNIGSVITHRMDILGAGVFSKDGERFAYLNSDTTLNIFSFDRCTGVLSNPVYVYFLDTLNLGTINCAFSSTGRYLYVCNNFHIFQLDMQAADIAASKTIVALYDGFITSQGFRTIFAFMKLAPDNKIYISTYEGSKYFHVINNPDSAGHACNVIQRGFILPDFNALSMPNVSNYALGPLAGSSCDTLHIEISEIENRKFSLLLYPNPASGNVNIQLNGEIHLHQAELSFYNSLGKLVYHRNLNSNSDLLNIDTKPWTSGIYTCVIRQGDKMLSGRVSVIK